MMTTKLQELYREYFQLTTERYNIENDRANWPKGMNYEGMVKRVNEIAPEVRLVRQKILDSEKGNKLVMETIENLERRIWEISEYIENLKAGEGKKQSKCNIICYFPSTYTSIAVNPKNGGFQIVNNDYPEEFVPKVAEEICNTVRNGRNESPIALQPKYFYPNYLAWMQEQFENMKTLLY